ncbi:MAG TPA: hypothetical protein VGX69_09635 [Solirubrobacteraceae bacterium]|nr:hypothetical protein [Solirubrobacteraceae bacterium]
MRARAALRRSRRVESWLWTGPVGHLLGGALDVAEALVRHAWRTRTAGAAHNSR